MSNTFAVEEEAIENVLLNSHEHHDDDHVDDSIGKSAAVVLLQLDQSFNSPQLKSTIENQTKLHMDWYNKMVPFYTHKAIIIPLEYCVSPSRAVLPTGCAQYFEDLSRAGLPSVSSVNRLEFNDFRRLEFEDYFKQSEFEDDFTQRERFPDLVFLFQHGDNLSSAMSISKNYVSFNRWHKKEEENNSLPLVDTTTTIDEEFSAKKQKTTHKDIEKLDSSDFPDEFRTNREFMMKQVEQNGLYLYYAHPDLLQDEELLLTAIKNNHESMKYVPITLRSRDEKFVKKALEVNGGVFVFLKQDWRSRQDFFELSLKTSFEGFSKVDDRLITAEVVEKAISQNWKVIKYVDTKKPFYTKMVENVLKQNIPDDELIGSNLISDTRLIIKMLDVSHRAFFVATKASTLDEEIIVKALDKNILLANYLTVDHFKLILGHVDLINQLIQLPDIDLQQLANCMSQENHPHIDQILFLISKRPTLVKCFYDSKYRSDPFILRNFDIETQLKILYDHLSHRSSYRNAFFNCDLGNDYSQYLKNSGYEFYSRDCAINTNRLNQLKERFSKSHPGLVIPFHRFGYSPVQSPSCPQLMNCDH